MFDPTAQGFCRHVEALQRDLQMIGRRSPPYEAWLNDNRRIIDQPITQEGLSRFSIRKSAACCRTLPLYPHAHLGHGRRGPLHACGICAKVCPPQCIWIVRDMDENGKPVAQPAEFYIDVAVCMSCSFCTEFCPSTPSR